MKRIFACCIATAITLVAGTASAAVIDAADYGFSPTATAAVNTSALQKALDGGNKTVAITVPGTYQLNATILLDDCTELTCAKGVVLQKAENYSNMFVNRGALTHTYNTDITLRGVHISVNGFDRIPDEKSPLFGLRGQVSFLCAHEVQVYGFRCEDLANMQYAIQFNQCDHYVLDTFVIRGKKDGVHISSSDVFVVRNGVLQTFDDAIALNASDWNTSNCVDGDITNGLIENIIDEKLNPTSGLLCRLLVGAWVDWHEGISIKRSDMVVHNGCLYKAIAPVSNKEFFSATEPTIDSFEGYQEDAGGFQWKLVRKDVYYSTNIRNITFRNITSRSRRCAFGGMTFLSDCEWARNLHPEVPVSKYPHIENIVVEDSDMSGTNYIFNRCSQAHTSFTFRNVSNYNGPFLIYGADDPSVKCDIHIVNCNLTGNTEPIQFTVGKHSTLVIRDCIHEGPIRIKNEGTVVSNCEINYVK